MSSLRSLFGVLVSAATVLVALTVVTGAADPIIASVWKTSGVSADGSLIEWGDLKPVATGLQIAAANDETSVYVALLASDEQMRVSLSAGVVFWLDASGGHKETLGLQLPGPAPIDPNAVGRSAQGGLRLNPTVLDRVDVLGPGKLARRLVDLDASSGMAAGIGGEDGGIVFEARIPLAATAGNRISAGVSPGRSFGLGIATPIQRKSEAETEPVYWFDPYAGTRIMGVYRPNLPEPPMPDSSNRPAKVVKPKQVKIWLSVQLAKAK